jgi:large subunit ribosomal protein L5
MATTYKPRLKSKYREEVIPALQKQFQYSSPMQVPVLKKICINQVSGMQFLTKR